MMFFRLTLVTEQDLLPPWSFLTEWMFVIPYFVDDLIYS